MNEETMVVPSALKGMASTIIPKFMSDDLEPQIYDTPDLIKEKFIVPKADSITTASSVAKVSLALLLTAAYSIWLLLRLNLLIEEAKKN
mgnify:CR=1 FL=1